MKKSITIPKIEEELYNNVKAKAEENNKSVSDYVSSLFEKSLNPDINEEKDNQSEEIQKLQEEIEKFNIENNALHQENREFRDKLKELEQRLKATEEENEQFLKIDPNKITVEFDDLERALIYFICERESKRVGKEIYPNQLLKAMFVNYSIKGDSYFFKHPTRSEILELKKKLNTENNE